MRSRSIFCRELIRRAGAEGAVLLKNVGLLPLAQAGTVAVIGPNAKVAQIMGSVSAQFNPHYRVSPWHGLVGKLGEDALRFAPGCANALFEPLLTGPIEVEFFHGKALEGLVVASETLGSATMFWIPPIGNGAVEVTNFSALMRAKSRATKSG